MEGFGVSFRPPPCTSRRNEEGEGLGFLHRCEREAFGNLPAQIGHPTRKDPLVGELSNMFCVATLFFATHPAIFFG